MTEPTEKKYEFSFCYNCGKRTNIPSDHGFIWQKPDGSSRYTQCQKCGDELTQAIKRLRVQVEKIESDYDNELN